MAQYRRNSQLEFQNISSGMVSRSVVLRDVLLDDFGRAYIGITGKIFMDFKADRIMDYAVYSLREGDRRFKNVLIIPMTNVRENGTTCSSWIVRLSSRYL